MLEVLKVTSLRTESLFHMISLKTHLGNGPHYIYSNVKWFREKKMFSRLTTHKLLNVFVYLKGTFEMH